jgi:hypothetical protein
MRSKEELRAELIRKNNECGECGEAMCDRIIWDTLYVCCDTCRTFYRHGDADSKGKSWIANSTANRELLSRYTEIQPPLKRF